METPLFPSATFTGIFQHVYEPAEDTFLMLDALEADLALIKAGNPSVVVEVGSGAGGIITSLKKALGHDAFCLAIDINPRACQATRLCAEINGDVAVDVVQGNLLEGLAERLKGLVDLLIFNPPYVATTEQELANQQPLFKSWAGGKDGMVIVDSFLKYIPDILSSTGRFYLLLSKENGVNDVIRRLGDKKVYSAISMERRCGREHLTIISGQLTLR